MITFARRNKKNCACGISNTMMRWKTQIYCSKVCTAQCEKVLKANLVLMAAGSDIMLGGQHHKVDAAIVKRIPEWRVLMPAVVLDTVLS